MPNNDLSALEKQIKQSMDLFKARKQRQPAQTKPSQPKVDWEKKLQQAFN